MSRSLCFWSCFRPPRKLPQLPVLRAVVIWPEGARYAFNWWSHPRFWGKCVSMAISHFHSPLPPSRRMTFVGGTAIPSPFAPHSGSHTKQRRASSSPPTRGRPKWGRASAQNCGRRIAGRDACPQKSPDGLVQRISRAARAAPLILPSSPHGSKGLCHLHRVARIPSIPWPNSFHIAFWNLNT